MTGSDPAEKASTTRITLEEIVAKYTNLNELSDDDSNAQEAKNEIALSSAPPEASNSQNSNGVSTAYAPKHFERKQSAEKLSPHSPRSGDATWDALPRCPKMENSQALNDVNRSNISQHFGQPQTGFNNSMTGSHLPGSDDRRLKMQYRNGDLLNAPENSVLVHSCNTEGSWGKGIALSLKKRFEYHFKAFKAALPAARAKRDLLGKAILIWPQPPIINQSPWIGCLFTKSKAGKTPPRLVGLTLERTRTAMQDLMDQLAEIQNRKDSSPPIGDVCMPKINAGYFGIDWERTREVLENIRPTDSSKTWTRDTVFVYTGEEEPAQQSGQLGKDGGSEKHAT